MVRLLACTGAECTISGYMPMPKSAINSATDKQEKATDLVVEQAEVLCDDWVEDGEA